MIVLDASAILAFFKKEPGWDTVAPHLPASAVATVNLAEVLSRIAEVGGDQEYAYRQLADSGCELVPVSIDHSLTAARLRPVTKSMGLSLGDRFCLALAMERKCSALTADRNWAKLDIGVSILVIR